MPAKLQTDGENRADPLGGQAPSRYVVGIDLGTTNCAVAFVDTHETPWRVQVFRIPQLVAAAQVEARETLPSFHFQSPPQAAAGGTLRLPWSDDEPAYAVGVLARDEGALTPGRLISSVKSWLCHSGVDRTADVLPWQGSADVERLSPVEVTARYLRHIRDAWNAQFSGDPLAAQQVVITLPASFDEIARELTLRAAAAADLPRVVLIEEPQAAFYAWVYKHAEDWHARVEPGQKILVCDIGGGTTDFTLIHVQAAAREASQNVRFHRIAVGEHLILGGDNLDLALAHHVERKLVGDGRLGAQQWDVLVRSARRAKETLLGEAAPETLTLNLPATGSRLIGGGTQAELGRDEVESLLVEGFLPQVGLDEKPAQRQSGFQEFGLPYAPDAAITRYLAAFLTAHRHTAETDENTGHDAARPDVVLFNGGFFASPVLRERLLAVLTSWFTPAESGQWSPIVLDHDRLDLAVARGAAYYGMVQRGQGVRIAANLARSYYIGVGHDEPLAVCLIPADAEAGQQFELTTPLRLTISEPVEFPLFVSSTRTTDQPGETLPVDREQLRPLPPIRTVLHAARRSERGTIPVHLHARLTEIGTIDLWCSEAQTQRRWRLQFDVRSATQSDVRAHQPAAEAEGFVDQARWTACRQLIAGVFDAGGSDDPAGLVKRLGAALQAAKHQWPTSLLRQLWEVLMEFEPGRRRSAAHEARWLNLLGFALRPGYGFAVDDWRVAETWRAVYGRLHYASSAEQALILWRRLAGGLSRGQQVAVAEPAVAAIRALHRRFAGGSPRSGDASLNPSESMEIWRLVGSLELLAVPVKVQLGQAIVELSSKRKLHKVRDAMIWALGRLGQRVPIYGPLNTIVPSERAAAWLEVLMHHRAQPIDHLAAMQLARYTEDRHRDLAASLRQQVADWISGHGGPDHFTRLVLKGGRLEHEELNQVFGESLPMGLRIPDT